MKSDAKVWVIRRNEPDTFMASYAAVNFSEFFLSERECWEAIAAKELAERDRLTADAKIHNDRAKEAADNAVRCMRKP